LGLIKHAGEGGNEDPPFNYGGRKGLEIAKDFQGKKSLLAHLLQGRRRGMRGKEPSFGFTDWGIKSSDGKICAKIAQS